MLALKPSGPGNSVLRECEHSDAARRAGARGDAAVEAHSARSYDARRGANCSWFKAPDGAVNPVELSESLDGTRRAGGSLVTNRRL